MMKNPVWLAALLLVCGVSAGQADSTMDEVRAELNRAVAAGELSRDEAKALMRDAVVAHRAERHARRDAKHFERDARKTEKQARREARRAEKEAAED
jgi:polyhydroxyalkanoate synthesis regulator phasin